MLRNLTRHSADSNGNATAGITSEQHHSRARDSLPTILTAISRDFASDASEEEGHSPHPRQRRRLDDPSPSSSGLVSLSNFQDNERKGRHARAPPYSSLSPIVSSVSPDPFLYANYEKGTDPVGREDDNSLSSGSEGDGDFASAIGQLSLNEDEEVRYHGKS
jgi:hypothetical protein